MPFKKGTSGNPKGRPVGSKNKLSNELLNSIHELVMDNMEQFREDLKELSPKDRIQAMIQMTKIILPKDVNLNDISNGSNSIAPMIFFSDTDYPNKKKEALKDLL